MSMFDKDIKEVIRLLSTFLPSIYDLWLIHSILKVRIDLEILGGNVFGFKNLQFLC